MNTWTRPAFSGLTVRHEKSTDVHVEVVAVFSFQAKETVIMPTNFRDYACSLFVAKNLLPYHDRSAIRTHIASESRVTYSRDREMKDPLELMLQCFSTVDMQEARTKEGCTGHIRAKRSAYSPLPLQVGHGGQGRETFVRQFRLR